jgi:hypothetical protein
LITAPTTTIVTPTPVHQLMLAPHQPCPTLQQQVQVQVPVAVGGVLVHAVTLTIQSSVKTEG